MKKTLPKASTPHPHAQAADRSAQKPSSAEAAAQAARDKADQERAAYIAAADEKLSRKLAEENKKTQSQCEQAEKLILLETKQFVIDDVLRKAKVKLLIQGKEDYFETLLKLLEKNSWYYDEYQGYLCKFDAARKSYQETISQTSYFLEAEINEIKYLGMGSYQMTMHVPAFAGNEESDPHEAYDLIYTIDIYESDPSLFTCTVESSDHVSINSFFYESDKGLSLDELLKQLEANGDFFCETLGTIGSFNATEKTYEEMMDATSYYLKAAITDFRYLQAKQYELTLHVDGFEGNEMTDPYDPYDIIMVLTYDTLKPKEYDAVMAYPASDYSLSGHFVSRQ